MVSEILAHAPLGPGDNESLETATEIIDPTKSWAIYAELHEGGEAQYYRFNATAGQRIHVMLYKSTRPEDTDFLPGFVLMGPQINEQGEVPEYVETPPGVQKLVAEGKQASQATYEPFSPGVFYSLADVTMDAPASGTYYVAVYEPDKGGHYGLAIGDRESYDIDEWILIPLNLLNVFRWEGQSLVLVFAPMVVTFVIGIGFLIWQSNKKQMPRTAFGRLGSLAGFLFIGTGAITFYQMIFSIVQSSVVPEVAITLVFILIPILLGLGAIRFAWKGEKEPSIKNRIYIAIMGVAALFAWTGLYIGPALAIITGILPRQQKRT